MRKAFAVILFTLTIWGCQENHKPKPKGQLALNFPAPEYGEIETNCPYSFKVNKITTLKPAKSKEPCMFNIEYPTMDGTIYITYEPVKDNLDKLLKDAQQLPLKHTIKADEIIGDEYTNPNHRAFGMLYSVTGNAASQAQFYLTDSTEHFITGSIYFRREPNYDSIYPAAEYLKSDMKKIMESLEWRYKKRDSQ